MFYSQTTLANLEKCFADDGIDVAATLKAAKVQPRLYDPFDLSKCEFATHEALDALMAELDRRAEEESDAIRENLATQAWQLRREYAGHCRMIEQAQGPAKTL